jgi:hypothetical protein
VFLSKSASSNFKINSPILASANSLLGTDSKVPLTFSKDNFPIDM